MKLVRSISALRSLRAHWGKKEWGLVPTMGYLHAGHMSLVEASRKENPITLVSIFVNPTQFGPGEDLERYPRDLERDRRVLEEAGVDALFLPEASDMYPPGYVTRVEQSGLGDGLCGRSRPGHFSGVLTVVAKLLILSRPRRAYFGRKDAQQAVMLSRMIRDLNLDVTMRTLPIVRDPDGLALSSRNVYLSPGDRARALVLPRALKAARRRVEAGERDAVALVGDIRAEMEAQPGVRVEYVEAVSLDDLRSIERVNLQGTLVAAAVHVGATRLIDNFILGEI